MLKIARSKVPNGKKDAYEKQLMASLELEGAITRGQPFYTPAIITKPVDELKG